MVMLLHVWVVEAKSQLLITTMPIFRVLCIDNLTQKHYGSDLDSCKLWA